MTLANGTRLGSYEILAPLGAGGMGEVYRAKDTKLGREVAIKVLPEAMTRDPERVARFQREAKLLASLNHPNIAAIYGFETVNSPRAAGFSLREESVAEDDTAPASSRKLKPAAQKLHFLVMELVEGETLAQRIKSGAFAVEDALDVAKQMAEALEAAHEKGVIHRDLKPANVMIRQDGSVKVLDFGLAKAMTTVDERSQTEIANSPTITLAHSPTAPGIILGTAAYMSPEQARGKPLDKRTDIWSFGVVVMECLTGRTMFGGETISDSIGAILHKEPDWTSLPEDTPPTVHLLLRRCLTKNDSKRLRDIGDARIELENAIADPTASSLGLATSAIQAKSARSRSKVWPTIAALLSIALGISLWRTQNVIQDKGAASNSATVVTEISQLTDMPGMQIKPSLSPNGKSLLFVAREGNDFDIFLQRVGGENPINLTADCPSDDYDPAFSPDGERIAFRSQREGGGLFVMGATGESPRRVSETGFDPAWSPDGTKLVFTTEDAEGPYSRSSVAQLWEIDLQSLEQRLVTKHDGVAPCYSPSGKLIAFWAAIAGVRDIFTIPTEGGEPLAVTNDVHTDWNPFFSPDGRTLYFISDRSGTPDLWRVPIDPTTGSPKGALRPVTAGVTTIDQATIAADGKHIMFSAPMTMNEIVRYEFDSKSGQIVGEGKTMYATTSGLQQFDVTPDGRRLTYRTGAPREDLIVMNADGTGRRRLMDDTHKDRGPRWSPDEAWILFYSNRGGFYDLWRIRPDGTGLHRLTNTQRQDLTNPVLSEDEHLLVTGISLETGKGFVLLSLEKAIADITEPLSIPIPERTDFAPSRFSPDAKYLAGNGAFGLMLYDVESQEITRVTAPDGDDMFVSQVGGMDWIDDQRLIVWDDKRQSAFIFDRTTGTSHAVPGIQGPCDIRVVEGGRALVVNRLRAESDIWMLRLATINEPLSQGDMASTP